MNIKTLFFAILILGVQEAISQTYSTGPTDDSYFFFHSSKTDNFGSDALLRTRFSTSGEFRTDVAIKFDITASTLTPPYDRVVLKLYGTDDGVVCPVRILKIASTYTNYNWTEATINGAVRPGTNYATDSIAQVNFEGDFVEKYHEWDITNWVNTEKAAGRNIINLHIRQMSVTGTTFNDPIFFHSKENTSGFQPLLVLQNVQSGLSSLHQKTAWAYVTDGCLQITDPSVADKNINIYSPSGSLVKQIAASDTQKRIGDLKGIFILRVGDKSMKLTL